MGIEPQQNFYQDLKEFIGGFENQEGTNAVPLIIEDWNEECKGVFTTRTITIIQPTTQNNTQSFRTITFTQSVTQSQSHISHLYVYTYLSLSL